MTTEDQAGLDEQIEIAAGRRAPYSQVGDWIALAAIDPQAKTVYWALKMHTNQTRGDGVVWPSLFGIADMLGYGGKNRDATVGRYLQQLVRIGAVDVERTQRGMVRRNRYRVHDTPPDWYDGPRSLEDWYRARRAETAGEAVPLNSGGSKPAGQPVPRSGGGRYPAAAGVANPVLEGVGTPPQRGYVPRPSGVEQDEVKQDEDLSIDTREHERASDEFEPEQPQADAASSLPSENARQLAAKLDYGPHARPSSRQVDEIAARVDAALAGGLSLPEIRRHAQAKVRQAKTSPVAYLLRGLEPDQLPIPTPPPDAARRNPASPPRKPRSAAAEAAWQAARQGMKTTVTTRRSTP